MYNNNPTGKSIDWWNNNGKWDRIESKNNQLALVKLDLGGISMICKLWRSSYERNGLTCDEKDRKLQDIEIETLQELLDLVNKEGYVIKLSPKSENGMYWIEIDDYFEN